MQEIVFPEAAGHDSRAAAGAGGHPGLRAGRLTLPAIISQSVASISPTFTPALNIAVVATLAGSGSWVAYLLATAAMLLVAYNIALLARRHPQAGSYFVYIGRNLGGVPGVLAGWIMIGTYIWTAATVILGGAIFLDDLMAMAGFSGMAPPHWLFALIFCAALAWSAVRDVQLSARIGLVLEGTSILIIVAIVCAALGVRGQIIDPQQIDVARLAPGRIASAMVFAIFSFVGFESAATFAKEAADPRRSIPRALFVSVLICGLFFVVMAYCIRLVVGDRIPPDGNQFTLMTQITGLGWTAGLVYFGALISAFACALASVNAAARLLFSMGRYGFLHAAAGRVHHQHQTPHVAAIAATVIACATALAALQGGLMNAYTWVATITTFGFLSVYGLICIAAPRDARKTGEASVRVVAAGGIGALLILAIFVGTLASFVDLASLIISGLFMLYVVAGLVWCLRLRRRAPERLANLQSDLED